MNRALEIKVGAFVAASLAVLVATLVVTGPLSVFSGQRLAIDFAYAGPVKSGAAVRVSGIVVGSVERVELLGGRGDDPAVMVRVHARIGEEAVHLVTDDARYYVTTLGVLGEHYVDLEPGKSGARIVDGGVVRGVDLARPDLLLPRAASLLEILRGFLDEGRPDAVVLMKKVTDLVEKTEVLLGSDEGQALSESARSMLAEVRTLVMALNTAVGDGQHARSLVVESNRTLQNGNRLLATLDGADLGDVVRESKQTLVKTRETLVLADGALKTAESGLLLDNGRQKELAHTFEKTFWELERAARSADKLLVALEKGDGALGEAFQDRELVQDLKAVLRQFRKNPAGLLFPGGATTP